MASSIVTGIASAAIPMILRSELGQKLLSKVGLSGAMFSPPPMYDYMPSPYHVSPSMDMYQRDYVTHGEMHYMGPSAVRHVQQAAVKGDTIHVVSKKKVKKNKKKAHRK